jgi:hypothetical protein
MARRSSCQPGSRVEAIPPFTKSADRAVSWGVQSLASFATIGYRRHSVIENTKAKTNNPSRPSSIIEARKRLAPSVDHAPCLVRVASSRFITCIRRIDAIKPITRNGSVTSTCERMEILTVCRNLHQHQGDEQLIQYPQSLGRNRGVTEPQSSLPALTMVASAVSKSRAAARTP